jgi:tetratricopeptide (TPR) repeat protein
MQEPYTKRPSVPSHPTKPRWSKLRFRWTGPILSSLTLVSCVTQQPARDPVPSLTSGSQENPAPASSYSQDGRQVQEILRQIQTIELAFARSNCAAVMRVAHVLLPALSANETSSLPLSARLAMSICASDQSPTHQDQAEAALSYVDEALQNFPPLWSTTFLLSLKAERFEALGRFDEARETRKAITRALDSDQRLRENNDLALLRLEETFGQLSAAEQDLLRRFVTRSYADGKQFVVLADIDTAAGQNPDGAFAELLKQIRGQLVARIEYAYAQQTARLIEAHQAGKEDQAEAIEEALLQNFPTLAYQRRTRALSAAVSPGGPIPLSESPTDALPDGGGLLSTQERIVAARKALDSGRPDQAVLILKGIAPDKRSGAATQLLHEAETVHIRELRLRVRDLFKRAESSASTSDKINDYEQCLEILRYTLREYPETQHRRALERNIRSVEERLKELNN